ncbi:MAG TPA: TIGR03089 family protein [Actinocrinis sp.]|nr:TIGR03089 family protein [Actinocrinis sp.]
MAQADLPSFSAVWRSQVAEQGPKPFVTFYDEGSGERVELSYRTFDNWLAKTGNLIQDDLFAQAGDRIAVHARPHWLSAVWLVAPLLTGAVVAPFGDPADAHTVVAGPESLDEVRAAAGGSAAELLGLSLLPLGMPFRQVPAGFRDFSAEVRAHGDRFVPVDPPRAAGAAVAGPDGAGLTHGELVAAARDTGRRSGDRLLVSADRDRYTIGELVGWLYGPAAAGASVVLVRGADQARREKIAESERTTDVYLLG